MPLLRGKAETVGLFSQEKSRLWGDLIGAFQYLKMAYEKDGDKLTAGHKRHFKPIVSLKEMNFRNYLPLKAFFRP